MQLAILLDLVRDGDENFVKIENTKWDSVRDFIIENFIYPLRDGRCLKRELSKKHKCNA